MKWPWRRREREKHLPDIERTFALLERVRGQREEAEEQAAQIRAAVVRNNFAANTFHLVRPGRR